MKKLVEWDENVGISWWRKMTKKKTKKVKEKEEKIDGLNLKARS